MKLIANRNLEYGGRSLRAGESFEASERHGKVLKAAHRASDAPPPIAAAPVKPMDTGDAEAIVPVRRGPGRPPKARPVYEAPAAEYGGFYTRRDMRAEDE